MSKTTRYFFIFIGVAVLAFVLWYFKHIVSYLLISAVLALMGRPLVELLKKVKIGRFTIPKGLCALSTLIVIWIVFFIFFRVFIPLIANEANQLSNADIKPLLTELQTPLEKIEELFFQLNPKLQNTSVVDYAADKITSLISISMVSNIFSSIASLLGNIFLAFFSISFITFFFLKDSDLFTNGIMIITPSKYEDEVRHALSSIKKLLSRYFIGILVQITGIITLVTLGLTIAGVGFKHGLVIGLFVGLMNVIPYIGPLIGGVIGLAMGIATHVELPFYSELLPMIGYMSIVFITVQVIDNILFQPLIYSSSVMAHPLEIFLVIMIAASLAGISGMILAIPTYTIIRVFAKEFFNNLKFVKKLTEKI